MNKEQKRTIPIVPAELPDDTSALFEQALKFRELMMMYNSAVREVQTKLEILNDEMAVRYSRSPIEFIKSRIKAPASIAAKLQKRGLPLEMDTITGQLNDVAGVRVICSFIDDIYAVADMLIKQDDIRLIEIKDYIKNPKPNGYRSFHLIIEVPVFFSDRKTPMRVEVQIRTIAMDFWASLEHQMKYKKNIAGADEIIQELTACADVIAETDRKMQALKNRLEIMEDFR